MTAWLDEEDGVPLRPRVTPEEGRPLLGVPARGRPGVVLVVTEEELGVLRAGGHVLARPAEQGGGEEYVGGERAPWDVFSCERETAVSGVLPPTLAQHVRLDFADEEARASLAYVAGGNAALSDAFTKLYALAREGGSSPGESLLRVLTTALALSEPGE